MDAGLQGERGVGVAQFVQADLGQHGPLHRLAEVAGDILGVQGSPLWMVKT